MPEAKFTLPVMAAFKQIGKLFSAGYEDRNAHFKATQGTGAIDPNAINIKGYFGYVEYPSIYHYSTSTGFREHPRPQKAKNPRDTQKNAMKFFSSVICDFDCSLKSEELALQLQGKLEADEIIDKLINPLALSGQPSTILLEGPIGCGKSTLLSSIMYSMWAQDEQSASVVNLPIKIDLRETLKNLVDPMLQEEYPNDENFCDQIEAVLCQRIRSCLHDVGIKIHDTYPNFDDILDACHRKNTNPIIILDELDILYYNFCLASANPSNNEIAHHKMLQRYCRLVNYFLGLSRNKLRSHINSPVVIIAARSSTLTLIEEVCSQQLNLGNSFVCPYPDNKIRIMPPTNSRVTEIIGSWVTFYLNVSQENEKSTTELIGNLSEIDEHLSTSSAPDLSKNLKLSVHGLRHIMKVLGKALNIDPSGALLKSYIKNPALLRIYQYLDGCEIYSQTTEGVSNIFLVNDEFKSQNEKINEYIPRDMYCRHLQTYWLKYFLLRYICYRQRHNGPGHLLMSDLVETFCFGGAVGDDPMQFRREIVFLLTLHATEVTHGRMIKLGTNFTGPSTKILASKRAELFDSENLYWEFSYLFVCVEDEWLRFPKGTDDYFSINEPWQRSYNFTVKYHMLTNDEKLKFLKYKAERVMAFLLLLEVALLNETKRCSKVFERLSDIDNNYFSVNGYVEKRRDMVLNSMLDFVRLYVGNEHVDGFDLYVKEYLASPIYKRLSRKMKLRYALYDRSWNSLRRPSTHMRAYHKNRSSEAAS